MGKVTKSDSKHNTTVTATTTPKSSSCKTQQEGGTLTEKSKNHVAAAKPPKSPAFSPPAHNRVNTTDASSSLYSYQVSSTSNRPELALFIQKQLAKDTEAGGINIVVINSSNNQVLSQLCSLNEKVYMKQGNPIRRKIHRKVLYCWKQYYIEGLYQEKVLDRLQVKPAAIQYKREKKTGEKKYARKVSLNKASSEERKTQQL
jgi:hypothetical protein